MFNLKQQEIIERYKHPQHAGSLPSPDLVADGANPLCGDEVHLEGHVKMGRIIHELRHTTRACAICTAAADLLAERVVGASLEEVLQVTNQEVTEELGIPLSPTRVKCAVLPLETLKLAIQSSPTLKQA